jgi:predicted MPP superfamily phosphohydrolase
MAGCICFLSCDCPEKEILLENDNVSGDILIQEPADRGDYSDKLVTLKGVCVGFDKNITGTVSIGDLTTPLDFVNDSTFSQHIEIKKGDNTLQIVCAGNAKGSPVTLVVQKEILIVGRFEETPYEINNQDATKRLSSIIYNTIDSRQPVERFKLVHLSDPHLSTWSGNNYYTNPVNLIESVTFANQPELKINAMVETGDHISSNIPAVEARTWMNSFFHFLYRNNQIPTFSCYGNHDANIEKKENYLTPNELAAHIQAYQNYPIQQPRTDRSYYYADLPNPQGGAIRLIALDMLDQPGNEYPTLHYSIFSQEQINWLGNVALKEDMTDRHSVIILTHFPFQPSSWGGRSATLATPTSLNLLYDGDFVHAWQMIPDIVESFRTHSSLKKNYPNRFYPERQEIKANFDFTNTAGEFVCYLGGHVHCFAFLEIQGTASTLLPQKMMICPNQTPTESGSRYNKVVRKENTPTSNSFLIYAVDTSEKKVYFTFFGAYVPSDDPSFPGILEFSYL